MRRVILLTAGVLLLFSACMPKTPTPQAASQEQEPVFAVATTTAVSGSLYDYLDLSGDVEPASTVEAYADTAGKLTRLYVDVGDYVKKGQVIAEVDPSRPGVEFVPSPVRAPISGTVVSLPLHIGSTVVQSLAVARISDLTDLEIVASVPERFIGRMQQGARAIVTFAAYPGETFQAVLTETSPVVDRNTRSLEIRLSFTSRDPRIKPGMFAQFKLITEERRNTVKIPEEALLSRDGSTFVFVVQRTDDAARVERREVVPGIRISGKAEILEGLSAGEEVVVEGQSFLDDGVKVQVVKQVPPLPVEDRVE